jgi:CRISPR-associated protein Cas1
MPTDWQKTLAFTNLTRAWKMVRAAKGSPGTDDVSLSVWGRDWESRLHLLSEQVRANTYRPSPLRRFAVEKPNGGWRELSILTVTDRVLQKAVAQIVEPRFESQFLLVSHAYRPARSVATAVAQVIHWRDKGYEFVLDADIRACFEEIQHDLLRTRWLETIPDAVLRNLMDQWLLAWRKNPTQAVGIPMGGVLSPLWCNIYLHPLDCAFTQAGWRVVRYADDFVILTKSERELRMAKAFTTECLAQMGLVFSPHKTRETHFQEGFTFLGVQFLGDEIVYDWMNQTLRKRGALSAQHFDQIAEFYFPPQG